MVHGEPGGPTELGPAYAPDGALAWSGWLLEEGGTPESLGAFCGATWSPDGLLIATTTDSAPGDLVIIDRDGTIVKTVADAGNVCDSPSWQRLPG
jgi:hypothetical protein